MYSLLSTRHIYSGKSSFFFIATRVPIVFVFQTNTAVNFRSWLVLFYFIFPADILELIRGCSMPLVFPASFAPQILLYFENSSFIAHFLLVIKLLFKRLIEGALAKNVSKVVEITSWKRREMNTLTVRFDAVLTPHFYPNYQ